MRRLRKPPQPASPPGQAADPTKGPPQRMWWIFLVLLLFLRSLRSAGMVFATIAFSILITLNLIYFGGYTLNVLTLMGIAMGFGLIVDNAIVVLENVYRRRRMGDPPGVAADRGARRPSLSEQHTPSTRLRDRSKATKLLQLEMLAMNKIRSIALVSLPLSVGALVAGCWDYSAEEIVRTADPVNPSNPMASTPTPVLDLPIGDGSLPCDVMHMAGIPCVSAHSTVRVIVPGYTGPLYQVEDPDGNTMDIGSVDGYADAAAQDTFCAEGGCVIMIVYDQSGYENDLTLAPPGQAKRSPGKPVNADDLPVMINGRSVRSRQRTSRAPRPSHTSPGDDSEHSPRSPLMHRR